MIDFICLGKGQRKDDKDEDKEHISKENPSSLPIVFVVFHAEVAKKLIRSWYLSLSSISSVSRD